MILGTVQARNNRATCLNIRCSGLPRRAAPVVQAGLPIRTRHDRRLFLAHSQRQDGRDLRALQAAAPADSRAAAPAAIGEATASVDPSPTLLFRYSALTFNGHRIHYDAPYATGVEGYPGLVVHGPLQATLLLRLAAGMRGRAPDAFSFQSLSTLYDSEPMLLNGSPAADGSVSLWTARRAGPVAMKAEARWW